jgi:hypothetical protein
MTWTKRFAMLIAVTMLGVCMAGRADAADVTLQWDPNPAADNVTGYRVFIGTLPGVYDQNVDVGNNTTYVLKGANPDIMYYFAVAAYGASGESAKSTIGWSIGEDMTDRRVKAVHIEQLRASINQLRAIHRLPLVTWTDSPLIPGVTPVRVAHLTEMRTALAQVYAARRIAVMVFSEGITPGATPIRASHILELRNALFDAQ